MDAPTQQGQLFDAKTEALLVEEAKAEDRAETEQRAPTHKKKTAKRQAIFTPSRPRRLLRWADRLRAPRGCVAWAATKSALRSGNKSRCSVMRLPVERATDSF